MGENSQGKGRRAPGPQQGRLGNCGVGVTAWQPDCLGRTSAIPLSPLSTTAAPQALGPPSDSEVTAMHSEKARPLRRGGPGEAGAMGGLICGYFFQHPRSRG